MNRLTVLKSRSGSERQLKFECKLLDIDHISIKSGRVKSSIFHTIYFRLNDNRKVKFFHIASNNAVQVMEYTLLLCGFLGVTYQLRTPLARKIFTV